MERNKKAINFLSMNRKKKEKLKKKREVGKPINSYHRISKTQLKENSSAFRIRVWLTGYWLLAILAATAVF